MMCDLTPERSRDDAPRAQPHATGHPLDPAIGILVGVIMGSAGWMLLLFAFWSVMVFTRC
jgi:hypothetical protein